MKFNPYEYQRRGVEWIKDHRRCALFWEMGLGKSVVTLSAMSDLMDVCEVDRVLVVAPKKVAESTWSREAEKWDHLSHLRIVKIMGTARQREAALAADADVYVTGRDSVVWLYGQVKNKSKFDAVVLDELTSFKSWGAQRTKAAAALCQQAHRVVGLTGTPTPNGLIDLWAQIRCIDGGERLGKFVTKYRDAYFHQVKWNNIVIRYTPKAGAEEQIQGRLSDICLTMQAADYLTLPPLTVEDRIVALPKNMAEGYARFQQEKIMEVAATIEGEENAAIMASSAAALMNKLSQYANGAIYDEEGIWHEIHREKVDSLVEIVEAAGRGVLVFYQYKHDAERIMKAIEDKRVRKYEGDAELQAWNAGEIDVLLAHPASTAYGLNMQEGGNYIVWFGTGWNLELYQQANARLYRQGQRQHVHVIRLITQGTVDERAAAALSSKEGMQQSLINGLKAMIREYETKKAY